MASHCSVLDRWHPSYPRLSYSKPSLPSRNVNSDQDVTIVHIDIIV
uniref:Uncharacterized protein n=1 Tax=Anguilla anguilla TaxID=7936 RepID=A0A0E9QE19_ANGAN